MKLFENLSLSDAVLPLSAMRLPFTRYDIVPDFINRLFEAADKAASTPVPPMYAHEFREFELNGNRTRMEAPYLLRRKNLTALLVGEYVAGDGRYIDALIDYVWAICEESSWRLSAHNNSEHGGVHPEETPYQLPYEFDDDVFFIDLFAAETGALLSVIRYLFADKLEKACPYCVVSRIDHELKRRIFRPFERYGKRQWWAGYTRPYVNNWNPWICANLLTCTAFAEADEEKRRAYTRELCGMIDNYVKNIPTDGCNSEGVSYFSVSTGAVFTFIELLDDMTGGAVDFHDNEIMRKAGEYIAKMNAGGYRRYVPFCDAPVNVANGPEKLYRYGRYFGSDMLMSFAGSLNVPNEPITLAESLAVDNLRRITTSVPRSVYHRQPFDYMDVWQIMTASTEKSGRKLYTAAKAGANNESHGHLDNGSFVLYIDGAPIFLDPGSPTYTKDTFNENRFKLWILRSPYHNTCTVDELEQKGGGQYKTTDVAYHDGVLSMEIKHSLSDTAGIRSLHREIDASDGFALTDTFAFDTPRTYKAFFMTLNKPLINGNTFAVGGASFTFSEGFDVKVERVSNEPDPRPARDYGTENLWRTVFAKKAEEGRFTMTLNN